MDAWILEWLAGALRWFHIVAAMGWIGTSLYFMWLDATFRPPSEPRGPVVGELWMVHSGHFYLVEKRRLEPGVVPSPLHWFKWEAGLTGLSGLGLLVVAFYVPGGLHLVDPDVSPLGGAGAIAVGVAALAVAWGVYDGVWTSPLARGRARGATLLSVGLFLVGTYGLTRLLSGRGAFIHTGAALGLIMVANVWMRIIPAQRELLAASRAGREPDYSLGDRAKRRSTHNSYLTFPVIFLMLSGHWPGTWGHPLSWLVLWLLVGVGMGIREFTLRLEAREVAEPTARRPAWHALLPVAACLAAALWLTSPAWSRAQRARGPAVAFAEVERIVAARCVPCHSKAPTDDVFRAAPNGVAFDTPASVVGAAAAIEARTVLARTMPLGNKTGMTQAERDTLGRWIAQGARPADRRPPTAGPGRVAPMDGARPGAPAAR